MSPAPPAPQTSGAWEGALNGGDPLRSWGPSVWLSCSSASERGRPRITVHEAHACPQDPEPLTALSPRSCPGLHQHSADKVPPSPE